MIKKEDGLLDLTADTYKNFLKYQAYYGWPGTYFFAEKNGKKIRVVIKDAEFKDGLTSTANVVFATNLILVGSSDLATFGKLALGKSIAENTTNSWFSRNLLGF